jgi:hypothetical protein
MMENARCVVSNDPAPAESIQPVQVESIAEDGKNNASRPKCGEHKRKRLENCKQSVGFEPRNTRRTQLRPRACVPTATTATAPTAKTSSKKCPVQKLKKARATTAQSVLTSSEKCKGHSSQYRGVSWQKSDSKWIAKIRSDGKPHYLGCFDDEEEAARTYDRAARAHHGEKARLNFPTKKEQAAEEAKQQRWIKCGEAPSKYRGVTWEKTWNRWRASIMYDGKQHHLGYFEDEEEVARAYDRAARAQHGEKAQLNFPKKHHLGSFEDEEEAARAYDRAARAHHGNAAKTNFEQPGKRHRGGGGTARTRDTHMTPLSSSSLPSPRKRPKAKQSNPAKKSKNKASKSSGVKAVDESKCYVCNCDVPEYTSSNHKSFRFRAPPVPVCGTECEAAYLAERGCTHFINTGRGKHHRLRIRTHATCIPTVYSLA